MDPSVFNSHYKAYKADTAVFLKWLFETGTSCGYTPSSQDPPKLEATGPEPAKTGRLKGKARKQAKQAAAAGSAPVNESRTEDRRLVALKDMVPLARAIVESTSPSVVPAWIINAGLRAISSRREYTKKIERATASDDSGRKKSNYTHSYFVSRLEEAILALRPLFANSSASNSSELGSQSGDNIEVLINCFEALHLEEPTEQPDEKERTPVESTGPVYDVELSKDEKDVTAEKHFALFCLFQDLARLRKFVQDLWSDYASDRVDLITASVATNASFQIAARAQDELLAAFPDSEDYQTILDAWRKGSSREGSDETKVDGEVARWLLDPARDQLSYYVDNLPQNRLLHNFLPLNEQGRFISQGQLFVYDPKSDWTKMTDLQQEDEDTLVLIDILRDVCYIERYKISFPVMDELTRGLSKMIASEKIPIWLTFAVTVFLDIHHTLRTRKDVEPLERPFNELQHIGGEASRTFEKHLEFSGQIEAPSTSQEGKEEYEKRKALEADHLQDLKREIDCFILDDILYYFKMKYYQEVEKVFPGESERFSLYHRHPVLCGILAFRTILKLRRAGVVVCNAWGAVINVAQFYNAVRKKADPVEQWPLMERVISIHTEKEIFIGAAPTNINESFNRALLISGFSASLFARNRRNTEVVISRRRLRKLKVTSILSEFFQKGLDTDGTMAFTIHNIEELLNEQAKNSDLATNPKNNALRREWATTKRLTSIQLLQALRDFIPGELEKLKFPYFQLHKLSIQLLQRLAAELDEEFKKYSGPRYNEYRLCFMAFYVIAIANGLVGSVEAKEHLNELRTSNAGSILLERAGGILDDFLRESEQ